MPVYVSAFYIGILVCHLLPVLLTSEWLVVLTISASIVFIIALNQSLAFIVKKVLFTLVLALAGFLYATLVAKQYVTIKTELPKHKTQAVIRVQQIMSQSHVRSQFIVSIIKSPTIPKGTLIRLSWYRPLQHFKVGEVWRVKLKVKPPRGFANEGSLDYAKRAYLQNVHATGYITQATRLSASEPSWLMMWRVHWKMLLENHVHDGDAQAFLKALILGDKRDLSYQTRNLFRDTGTAHILAISGLHVGLMALFAYTVIFFLWRISATLCAWQPAPRIASLAGLSAAVAYAALCGFSLPTERALIMLAVFSLRSLTLYYLSSLRAWWLALFLVLAHDPKVVLSASLYLSFIAVACLLPLGDVVYRRRWQAWTATQTRLAFGLMPLSLFFFKQIAWMSAFVNVVVIPWVGMLILPLGLISLIITDVSHAVGASFLNLLDIVTFYLIHFLQVANAMLGEPWRHGIVNITWFWLAMVGCFVLLQTRLGTARYLGLLLYLPLFLMPTTQLNVGTYTIDVFDVGQGLAVMIRTANHSLIFDTGPRFSPTFNTGDAVIKPFLLKRAITHLDKLVISHGDNDHSGGLDALMRVGLVDERDVLTSAARLLKKWSSAKLCREGMHWRWDGVDFLMLHPRHKGGDNNASCVLKITNGAYSVLLPGDIEYPAEADLVSRYASLLSSDILVAPHHGSKTSSSRRFLGKVKPAVVVFSTGFGNRYHFPHPSVVRRYLRAGVETYNTAITGQLSFFIPKTRLDRPLIPKSYRLTHPHWWQ